jgi:phospholipase C
MKTTLLYKAVTIVLVAAVALLGTPPVASADGTADPLANIDHFIIVYQENWSFDSLYGLFPGADGLRNSSAATLTQIDRLSGNALSSLPPANGFNRYTGSGNVDAANTNTNPGFLNIPPQPLNGAVDTRFNTNPADATSSLKLNTLHFFNLVPIVPADGLTGDIVHRYWHEQFQASGTSVQSGVVSNVGNNQGFITWSDNPGLVMSYFDATNLPEGVLAQQYTLGDNFFHSAFGGSFLNHQFLVAAAPTVYYNMPASNNGNIAYLDSHGVLVMNTSGSAVGKVVRDGNITPVGGEALSVSLNGTTQTVTANSVAFGNGLAFDKHYAVNTIFSANLQSSGDPNAVNLLPSQNNTNPGDLTRPFIPTIGDRLSDAGITWKWYSGGFDRALAQSPTNPSHFGVTNTDPSITLFQWHHQPFAFFDKYAPFKSVAQYNANPAAGPFNPESAAHLQDETRLYSDISNNTLPAVSFVKFLGPDNEHPGYTSLQQGQQHVADLVAAVQANPGLWARTAIIVTYDEHGGRWDHVTPPVRDIWGPGVRVPVIVISPFARRGFVDHTQYDTSSILSTIEHRFGLAPLNSRDALVPTLAAAFTNVPVTRSGFVYDRRTQAFVQQLTLTNISASPVPGPLFVVLDSLSANASLSNKTGNTTNAPPLGSPFIQVPNSSAGLGAGASLTVSLEFANPTRGAITYSLRVPDGTTAP